MLIFSIVKDSLRCIGKNQSMSFLASTISSIRLEKEANTDQCGLSQLTRITGLDEDYFGLSLDLENLSKSEITKIQTFVKESKKLKIYTTNHYIFTSFLVPTYLYISFYKIFNIRIKKISVNESILFSYTL